jgi:hypothetical protein
MSFRFALSSSCLFVILISMLVLAQSDRAPFGNRPNGLATAQEQHPGVPTNLSEMPQGAPFTQRRTRASKASAPLSSSSQASGLNFAPAVNYPVGGQWVLSVAVADLNGDSKPDLVVATECANSACVGVLLGNGDGTFQTAVTYESGGDSEPPSVTVADVNGDGKPDLVVANHAGAGVVGVLLGNGDGTFQTAVTYGSGGYGAYSVAVADVNGDGKPDLLVTNACARQPAASDISLPHFATAFRESTV